MLGSVPALPFHSSVILSKLLYFSNPHFLNLESTFEEQNMPHGLLWRFKETKVCGALDTVMIAEKSGHVYFTAGDVRVLTLGYLSIAFPFYTSAVTAFVYFLFFSHGDYCIWLASLFIASHPLNPSFILSQAFTKAQTYSYHTELLQCSSGSLWSAG